MTRTKTVDVCVLGSGFAGSLLSLILARQGRSVALLERGTHPRFAIGESSTPVANLTLEQLCDRYGLPSIKPLARYGTWKETHPELRCGLKRGFSFFHHEPGQPFALAPQHATELFVAANASEAVADTHWFREDVDAFLVRLAVQAGVDYRDRVTIDAIHRAPPWTIRGTDGSGPVRVQAEFLMDGTGPAAATAAVTGAVPVPLRTRSAAVYSHFRDVPSWTEVAGLHDPAYPFPADAAALHHLGREGWWWVLPFDHGVTSLGCVVRPEVLDPACDPRVQWRQCLLRYPSVHRHLASAQPVRPLRVTGPLQRRLSVVAGRDHALLPHTAYFVDPFLSSGNAHSLVGVRRLAQVFEAWPERPAIERGLTEYARALQTEIDFVDVLVDGAYRSFGAFRLLVAYLMYYFSGAIVSESRLREGTAAPDDGFLFSHHPEFRSCVMTSYERLCDLTAGRNPNPDEVSAFERDVVRDIEPYDLAGLTTPGRDNLHPFV